MESNKDKKPTVNIEKLNRSKADKKKILEENKKVIKSKK